MAIYTGPTKIVGRFLVRDDGESLVRDSAPPTRDEWKLRPIPLERLAANPGNPVDLSADPDTQVHPMFLQPEMVLTAAEVALRNEAYWRQAAPMPLKLPEVEIGRRRGLALQASLDKHWSRQPAFVSFGAKAKDEGRIMEELCELEDLDGGTTYGGSDDSGVYHECRRTDNGLMLSRQRREEGLQPIATDRRTGDRSSEASQLTAFNQRAAQFWARPYGQKR